MTTLNIAELSVSYGQTQVLKDLTLPALQPGEVTALIGPNAAGKSTLLRAVAQLVASKGSIRYGDIQLRELSTFERTSLIGFMPQSLPYGISLSVLESVLAALMATQKRGASGSGIEVERQAISVLVSFGIENLAMAPLDRLSGGQRQMVSLAQAVVRRPTVLLLDEPTSALDLRYQLAVMSAVRRIASEGRIVVIVLHDLDLAARWADRIVVLNDGVLHAAGTPADALTPAMLRDVYGVSARIERCSQGRLHVITDEIADAGALAPISEMHERKRVSA